MEKEILIFGHKNPDTDSITSSIVMENLEKKLGNENVKAVRTGEINKETQFVLNYVGIEAPELIENVKDDMQNEEIIHLVLEKQVSHHNHQNITRGQKIADNIAKFGGSWYFIITFVILLISWMIYNQFSKNSLDPYPFILLNLILSCLSALQAPIIMMSQNRQEQIDRQRNENDYKVNLKTEIIIQDLHNKLDIILEELEKINN